MDSILVVLLLILAIWLIVRVISAANSIDELRGRIGRLETEVRWLRKQREIQPPQPLSSETLLKTVAQKPPEPAPAKPFEPPIPSEPEKVPLTPPSPVQPSRSVSPPPIPVPVASASQHSEPAPAPASAPPPFPKPAHEPQRELIPAVNWEQFMGVKLFAWVGGLALFLGVAFFVKYSFDNNLVPPELRVAIGFLAGLGLLVGGLIFARKQNVVLAQTLCATGALILYAVTFACRSIYHFEFFGPVPTFVLMVLITATAFLVAVRLDALVVAILGMLGGFLTPILLSTGQDNPLGLFGYIAILDIGLIVVSLHRRWFFLNGLAALGTALIQLGWAEKFFVTEKYFEGNKILIALAVLLGFAALYLAVGIWFKARNPALAEEAGGASTSATPQLKADRWWLSGSTLGLAAVALAFTFWFLTFAPLAERPGLMFGFVVLIDLIVTALVLLDSETIPAHTCAGLAVFGLLAFWTARSLNNNLLNAGLAFYFIFAVVHSVFPIILQRLRGIRTPLLGCQVFPPLALVLVLLPIFQLAEVSFLVWPFVLLVDLLAIGLAVLTASIVSVLAALALTLAATGTLIFKIPVPVTGEITLPPTPLFLLGAFAVFFVAAGVWLARKLKPGAFKAGAVWDENLLLPENLVAQLPVLSATLPFLLLIMATLRLPLANPSSVFGLALLLVVLLLGVARLFSLDGLSTVGLVCVTALECAWHFNRFNPLQAQPTLIWYLVFFAVFAVFPFLFIQKFADKVEPWAAAAMAGLPQFFLIHRLVKAAYPNQMMGLLPAAFAVPSLLGLVIVLKKIPPASWARMTQLAWFGGVALFFITLIFPIQFDRQWITIGWALEGAALLWLFHRVPHPGLRLAGVGLLVVAFARLAVNPAVLEYHPRSATPILNWYLYAYGIVTICLFVGAWLLAPPRNLVLQSNIPPILHGLGTVLAFLLLNIEIADYFSPPGSTLTFQFSGDFARDMTYSIAWGLFALVLLVVGITRKIAVARYAALGLLSVTLLKLFVHDLSQLGQLYRIGAFIGVAVLALLASFAYQRFYAAGLKEKETKNETVP